MSEREFELYLSLLSRFLRLTPGQREEIADELRDHLQDRLDELTAEGLSREDAVHRALEEFGDAAELATHFADQARRRRRRFLMRCTLGSIVAAAAVIFIAFAMWPPMPGANIPPRAEGQQPAAAINDAGVSSRPVPVSPKDERQAAVEAKLAKKIENVKFENIPLHEALESIGEQIELDILINEQSLSDEGISLDEPVSLALKHTAISASTVLELISEQTAADAKLVYKIRDGFIYIQTAAANQEDLEVEVYNVRDMLVGVEPLRRTMHAGGGFGGGGAGFFQLAGSGIDPAVSKGVPVAPKGDGALPPQAVGGAGMNFPQRLVVEIPPVETLIEVIQQNTGGYWEAVDGTGGTISQFDGLLVVRQTQALHREIKQLLEMLRIAAKERAAKK